MRSPSDLTKLRALRGAAINTSRLHACRLSKILRFHLNLICQLASGSHHQHGWAALLEWLNFVSQHLRECRKYKRKSLPTPCFGDTNDVAPRCCHGPAICLNGGWSCKTCLQHSLHRGTRESTTFKRGHRRWDLSGSCHLGLSQISGVLPIIILRVVCILWALVVTEIPFTVLRQGAEIVVARTPMPVSLGVGPLAVAVALVAMVAEALIVPVEISVVSTFLITETVESAAVATVAAVAAVASLARMRIVSLSTTGTIRATSEAAASKLPAGLGSHLCHRVKPAIPWLRPKALAKAPVPLCPPLRGPVARRRALLHGRGLSRVELVVGRDGRRAIPHRVVGCRRRFVATGVVSPPGRAFRGVGGCCR
mmetsp:Transcript_19149/g.48571  ORF Transcript_19149/g.48571 Transcript_19149/m.48571 type:complete len:367 (+) Transcript_19149:1200-2300(+)